MDTVHELGPTYLDAPCSPTEAVGPTVSVAMPVALPPLLAAHLGDGGKRDRAYIFAWLQAG